MVGGKVAKVQLHLKLGAEREGDGERGQEREEGRDWQWYGSFLTLKHPVTYHLQHGNTS